MIKRIVLALIVLMLLFFGRGYWNATRDPLVREAMVHIADWPKDAPPIKALLISDIHINAPDMTPERVGKIAEQLNALKPDLYLIAGDLISEKKISTRIYSTGEVANALKAFHAPMGTVIAMGNHDHWADEAGFPRELAKAGMTVLQNTAVKRGPLVIGGVDDDYTHHSDLTKSFAAMDALGGPQIIVTHSPDIAVNLPHKVSALFAGHTHCGQIIKPWSGEPVSNVSRYEHRFLCGDINDNGQRIFVGAGLGTSVVPMRYGAPPDAWLVTLGP